MGKKLQRFVIHKGLYRSISVCLQNWLDPTDQSQSRMMCLSDLWPRLTLVFFSVQLIIFTVFYSRIKLFPKNWFMWLKPCDTVDLKNLNFLGSNKFKGRSHYSDNQSPTSNNHYFWGGCRRLSEVGKCLSMIGDWLSENYIDNLSPTSDNHPFSGWFSMVGKWLLMIAEQFWSARGFRCSINNLRQPNKAAIQNEYTFDPEKCWWWRNRGRVVLSWSATGRRLVVGADLHNQLYHSHFKRNSNMYSWNCPRMVVKM